jgi:L-threonylcarbamoyladenylate synthase
MVDFEDDIKKSVQVMQAGGIILYPTDTVWGIGCDATNEVAVQRILDLKQRRDQKSMIVLLADARDILQYVAAPPPDIIAIVESFDRPTTVIYENAIELAENVAAADGSIGIRVPDDLFCRALIKRLQKPIVSTSANISGCPSPSVFSAVGQEIISGVDYVVRYRQDDQTKRQPSRIVRFHDEENMTVVRQ